MKRIILLILGLFLAICFSACGNSENITGEESTFTTNLEGADSSDESDNWGVLQPAFYDEYYLEGIQDKKLNSMEKNGNTFTVFQHRSNGRKYAAVYIADESLMVDETVIFDGEEVPVIFLEGIKEIPSSYTVPEYIWQINASVFDSEKLESITFNEGLSVIGNTEFTYSLIKRVYIPSTVTRIDYCCFQYCRFLETVEFARDIRLDTISDSLFCDCDKLINISIPSSVTKIDWNAFEGCTELSSIAIPESVKIVEPEVFMGCTNLKQIIFDDPDGWTISYRDEDNNFSDPVPVDLSDPASNAKLLATEREEKVVIRLVKE